MARSTPMREPACSATDSSAARSAAAGSVPAAPTVCNTPIGVPSTVTGTHIAEQSPSGRSRRWGQASRSVERSKVMVLERRTAGQLHGVSTPQPGPPCTVATATRRRCARLESASSSSPGPSHTVSSALAATSNESWSDSAISNAACSRPVSACCSFWSCSDRSWSSIARCCATSATRMGRAEVT